MEVSFNLDKISEVNIRLFDSLGKLINSYPIGKRNGGTQSIPLIINDLPQGIYFLSLQTEDEQATIKIIK